MSAWHPCAYERDLGAGWVARVVLTNDEWHWGLVLDGRVFNSGISRSGGAARAAADAAYHAVLEPDPDSLEERVRRRLLECDDAVHDLPDGGEVVGATTDAVCAGVPKASREAVVRALVYLERVDRAARVAVVYEGDDCFTSYWRASRG